MRSGQVPAPGAQQPRIMSRPPARPGFQRVPILVCRGDEPITITALGRGRIEPPITLLPEQYLAILPSNEVAAMEVDCQVGERSRVVTEVPERAAREGDSQPLPTINDSPDVQSAVIADIVKRREVGIKRYGTALQPNNGRNPLLDAYEEVLDLACYLKQRLIEEAGA